MTRPRIDLAERIDGHEEAADFPVRLRPVYYDANFSYESVPGRLAVVREDTGEPLAVVSDRYALIPHSRILDAVDQAIASVGLRDVPRGIYLDRHGARLRALYKFEDLETMIHPGDTICPCLKIQNSYDATSRIAVHIGAFRFVCTNLAVGGGGVFAGGFMAVHEGDIPIEEVAKQLAGYLDGFGQLVALYRAWTERPLERDAWHEILESLPKRPAKAIRERVSRTAFPRVFDAYNAATFQATHRMRSVGGAFKLLERVNRAFQEHFPVATEAADPAQTGLTLEEAGIPVPNGLQN